MSTEPVWIPPQALVDLHREQIAEHGGAPGLQDRGLLESALARPQQRHAYSPDATMAELAAAYCWGLCKNHPFVDGNKRVALLAIGIFLGLNGYYLDAREEDAYRMLMQVAEGSCAEHDLAAWIEQNTLSGNAG